MFLLHGRCTTYSCNRSMEAPTPSSSQRLMSHKSFSFNMRNAQRKPGKYSFLWDKKKLNCFVMTISIYHYNQGTNCGRDQDSKGHLQHTFHGIDIWSNSKLHAKNKLLRVKVSCVSHGALKSLVAAIRGYNPRLQQLEGGKWFWSNNGIKQTHFGRIEQWCRRSHFHQVYRLWLGHQESCGKSDANNVWMVDFTLNLPNNNNNNT